MSWEVAALMDELGNVCSAHPGQELQLSPPCSTQAHTRAAPDTAAQTLAFHTNFNLPDLITPHWGLSLGCLPWSDPRSRMRVSLGAVPGSVPPQGPFPGAAGHPRTAGKARPSTEPSQGCAGAEQSQDRQDGVTSGHGAGLPLLPAEAGMGVSPFFFFLISSPFSISAVWKRGAELSFSPLHKLNEGQGLMPRFELSVPEAERPFLPTGEGGQSPHFLLNRGLCCLWLQRKQLPGLLGDAVAVQRDKLWDTALCM